MANTQQPAIIKGNRRRCLLLFVLAGGLGLAMMLWLVPWLEDFTTRAYCVEIAGHNGSVVLFGALFIGFTSIVFLFTLWLASVSGKILRSGQSPPPGAWVCRDTVPVTGRRARTRAYIGFVAPLFGFALLCWGIAQFQDIRERLIEPNLEKLQARCDAAGADAPGTGRTGPDGSGR